MRIFRYTQYLSPAIYRANTLATIYFFIYHHQYFADTLMIEALIWINEIFSEKWKNDTSITRYLSLFESFWLKHNWDGFSCVFDVRLYQFLGLSIKSHQRSSKSFACLTHLPLEKREIFSDISNNLSLTRVFLS